MQNHYQMYTYWRDIYNKMHHDYYKQHCKQLSIQNKRRMQAEILQTGVAKTKDL